MCTILNIKPSELEETQVSLVLFNVRKFGLYVVITFKQVRVDYKQVGTDQCFVVDHYRAYVTF